MYSAVRSQATYACYQRHHNNIATWFVALPVDLQLVVHFVVPFEMVQLVDLMEILVPPGCMDHMQVALRLPGKAVHCGELAAIPAQCSNLLFHQLEVRGGMPGATECVA